MCAAIPVGIGRFEGNQVVATELGEDPPERIGVGADQVKERAARARGQPGEAVGAHLHVGRERGRVARLSGFEDRDFELKHVDRHARCLRGRAERAQIDELRLGHEAFRDEDQRLGAVDLGQARDQPQERIERQPRVDARHLRHRAAFLLDLDRAGIAHALAFGKPARILVSAQQLTALAQHHLIEPRAAAVGDRQRLDEADVEMRRHRRRLAGQRLEVTLDAGVIARELNGAAMGDWRGGDTVGRIECINEARRGPECRTSLDPSDVRLIHRDEDQAAGILAFVRIEAVTRVSRGRPGQLLTNELRPDHAP